MFWSLQHLPWGVRSALLHICLLIPGISLSVSLFLTNLSNAYVLLKPAIIEIAALESTLLSFLLIQVNPTNLLWGLLMVGSMFWSHSNQRESGALCHPLKMVQAQAPALLLLLLTSHQGSQKWCEFSLCIPKKSSKCRSLIVLRRISSLWQFGDAAVRKHQRISWRTYFAERVKRTYIGRKIGRNSVRC